MAQKRMFALSVVESDRFVDMPTSAQCLYFHLGMNGDDDGFCGSPNRIMRAVGCNADDLKLLIAKRFIIPFDTGVIVISDWKLNNVLKNDRYRPTLYTMEKALLTEDESGRYSLEPTWNQIGTKLEPSWNQNITQRNSTQPNGTKNNSVLVKSRSQTSNEETQQMELCKEIKRYINSEYNFKYISVAELHTLIFDEEISPVIIAWIAMKSMSNADNPRSYFMSVIEEKCRNEGCVSTEDLISSEGDDDDEREEIIHINTQLGKILYSVKGQQKQDTDDDDDIDMDNDDERPY